MITVMAEHAGFCFGVKRAVDAIERALQSRPEVWTIGLPIHNPQEVARLEAMGLRVAQSESDIPEGAKVLIRAHGESLEVIGTLRKKGVDVEDMTCPFVKKAQDMAAELSRENYHVVLLGDKNHPEIKGIIGHTVHPENVEVAADDEEAERIQRHNRIALVSQTTQREERLAKVAGILAVKCSELHVCNTICKATAQRQEAARELVRHNDVDGVVLIGGRQSANTGKLRDIIEAEGVSVLWAEDEKDIHENSSWFMGKHRIGIAAGASTPSWLIDRISSIIAENKAVEGD
ncbi:MAG: 4-hydroxy-3-methylbut-2-enyl diphosphate reductase [Synergistaceae bacterium]|nr:4-hydroxy-3-methylbut-2-enyl diphosphate reductase [Synergistaceae bacterium]MBR0035065.1 4-hydroxy-3-methylbut-2-enyl diphosphate reductase [Synergistaceae bacterium]